MSIFPEIAPVRPDIRLSWEPDPRAQNPSGWIETRLGEFIWSKQKEVADAVRDHRYTAVQSAHGTGKSYIASRLAAWWLDVHSVGDAFVVTTAPSATQVRAILWREIGKAHRKGKLDGYITGGDVPEWKMGAEIVGYGRKPADYTDPNQAAASFSGIHARYVLVILDEAGGIPMWLWDAVDTLVTNDDARVLAIGNPDDPASQFEKVCRPGSGWHNIKISAFDLPCFTGEEVPDELHQNLTGKRWVEERKKRWGEGSPIYISKVLGEFPEIGEDTLISPAMIRAAIECELSGVEVGRFGADIARLGKDKNIVYWNRGGQLRKILESHKKDLHETTQDLRDVINGKGRDIPMWIDITGGLGAGPYDTLKHENYNVMDFNSGYKAADPQRYKNMRAEAYWNLRDLMEEGLIDIDPDDLDLQAQLGSVNWKHDSAGRIQIESKDDIIKRLGVSPDYADAAVMSSMSGDIEVLANFLAVRKHKPNERITENILQEPM